MVLPIYHYLKLNIDIACEQTLKLNFMFLHELLLNVSNIMALLICCILVVTLSLYIIFWFTEMGERVKCMLKIVEGDGDSFARKAEMYFKKRPELVHFVEETFKAYKALADRYDHISSELHKANHTIATAFPDQIQFDMDDDDDNLPKAFSSIDASKLRKPSVDVPQISLMNNRRDNQIALKKSRLARITSQTSKDKAQEEIDKLQKGILVLQTEKEYIKSSYESGITKYWDIEKKITDMQEDVFLLQDEYSASVVIEDDDARALMAVAALKSCERSLVKLEEQQKLSMGQTRRESETIKAAKEKIEYGKGFSQTKEIMEGSNESTGLISTDTNTEEEGSSQNEEGLDSETSCDIVKEDIAISSETSVVELAEKINELVTKVIEMELTASCQNAQLKSLRSEADILYRHLQSFEEEKRTLIEESNSLRDRLKEAEEKLQRALEFQQHVEEKRSVADKQSTVVALPSLDDFSVEGIPPKYQDLVNTVGLSQEATSLHDTVAASVSEIEVKKTLEFKQDEKCKFDESSTGSCRTLEVISERLMSPKHQEDQVNFAGPSKGVAIWLQNEKAPRDCENKEVEEIFYSDINLVEESQRIQQLGPSFTDKSFDHSEAVSHIKDSDKSQVVKQEFEISSSQAVNNVHQPQLETSFDHSEAVSLLKDDSVKSQVLKPEVEISPSQADHNTHPSKASSNLGDDSMTGVMGQEVKMNSSQANDNIHQSKKSIPQLEKSFDHLEAGFQLQDGSEVSQVNVKKEVKICSSDADDNILRSKESKPQFEDQEIALDWLQSLIDGVEGKEKIILAEYSAVLRSYKDMKKRLSEVEKKNQECLLETTTQIKELKSANAMKDNEIHSLRKNLRSAESNSNRNTDACWLEKCSEDQKTQGSPNPKFKAIAKRFASFDVSDRNPFVDRDIKQPAIEGRLITSAIEEKFRRDIDTVLEENLEFWLRFSTSFHGIQKFQTTFQELQAEIKKLKHKKLGEGSSHSLKTSNPNSMPIDRKLRELKTELHVWLEQNMLLQGELEKKLSSIGSMQEEISGTLEASLEASLEADVAKFAPYQAAKFQGELLNMQLENNKVAEELKAGLDHISELQAEVEKAISRLHARFELPKAGSDNHEEVRQVSTKNRVPLKSFLFNPKPKKKPFIFACVNPVLHKHMANRPHN